MINDNVELALINFNQNKTWAEQNVINDKNFKSKVSGVENISGATSLFGPCMSNMFTWKPLTAATS